MGVGHLVSRRMIRHIAVSVKSINLKWGLGMYNLGIPRRKGDWVMVMVYTPSGRHPTGQIRLNVRLGVSQWIPIAEVLE